MSGLTVLSPVGINRVEARPVSARVPQLAGIRLGLLNNNKPNAKLLLDRISGLIGAEHGLAGTAVKQKPHSSVGAEHLDDYAKEVQAAIVAVGDWGSCTSWSIHDAIELEKRGIPTVTVCTEAFIGLAREESRNLGMPDLPIAIIQHPLGGLKGEQVGERSREALDQVVLGLTRDLR